MALDYQDTFSKFAGQIKEVTKAGGQTAAEAAAAAEASLGTPPEPRGEEGAPKGAAVTESAGQEESTEIAAQQ